MSQQPGETSRDKQTHSESRIVLTLHGLGKLPRELADHSDPEMWIDPERFEALLDSLPPGVELTFDDGFASCLTVALPALMKRNMRARFFVTLGHLHTNGYLTNSDLQTLLGARMLIGSHGMRHRPWLGLDQRTLTEEIFETKDYLEQILGCPVTEAACPFGAYDRRTLGALREAGMRRVYTSDRLPASSEAWFAPRYTLRASETFADWKRIMDGKEPLFPSLRRLKIAAKRWR